MYIGDSGVSLDDPRVSPLFGSFDGLPPLLLMASSTECIRDDGRRTFEKAQAAGVRAVYYEGPNMCHIWPIFADRLPQAREALVYIGTFAQDCFAAEAVAS